MKVYILKNEYFKSGEDIPQTATQFSTGYDIKSVSEPEIHGELVRVIKNTAYYKRIDYIQYHTGLYLDLDPDVAKSDALIFPRSSVSKYNLQLANSIGLCDNDYRGEYLVRFNYIIQPEDLMILDNEIVCKVNMDRIYKKGEKIAQLKFSTVIHPEFILTSELSTTERGSGGFGSTDNKIKKNPIQDRFEFVNKVEQDYNQKPTITKMMVEKYNKTYQLHTSTKYTDIISQRERELNNE